jgi:stress response protein YsnF
MHMLGQDQINQVQGSTAYGSDGSKIGTVGQIYLDDQTGQPAWVTVNTGLFGSSESFVPLQEASYSGDRLTVPYDKDKIKNAPNVSEDGHLEPDEEQRLYEYYGLNYSTTGYDTTTTTTTEQSGVVGNDVSGPETDNAMTRSEEQLRVGKMQETAGSARLRKYVVSQPVEETVSLTQERAVLQREPITEANMDNATSGPTISEEEHEVTLTQERPVVEKTATPVERVRLDREAVTTQETVSDEVRSEQIEVEGDVADTANGYVDGDSTR